MYIYVFAYDFGVDYHCSDVCLNNTIKQQQLGVIFAIFNQSHLFLADFDDCKQFLSIFETLKLLKYV